MTSAERTTTTRTLVAGRLLDVNRAQTTSDTVRRTVKALGSFYSVPAEDLARATGMSRATWFTRTSGKTDFSIGETAVLADLFECSVDDLMTGNVSVKTPTDGPYTRARRISDRRASISYYERPARLTIVPDPQVDETVEHAATAIAQLPSARPTERHNRLQKVA